MAGQYVKRYGNLRRDGVDEVLSRAMADGPSSDDELWFPGSSCRQSRNLQHVSAMHKASASMGGPSPFATGGWSALAVLAALLDF